MSSKDGAEVRARAARVVAAVAGGRSLDAVLDAARKGLPLLDQGLLTALSFGVLRDRRLLQTLIQPLSARPPAPLVQALLLVGVYQLRSLRVPAHAAVHATVAASARRGQPRARGLV
ncbi:MAG: hypothetical protein L0H83_01670, partial [Salinisphaera sp.]|nr:hypothetical protein [Salinisphaera sp.]